LAVIDATLLFSISRTAIGWWTRRGLNFKTDDDAIARAKAIAIMVSIDTPAADPTRHIVVLNGSREEIFRVAVYSKPAMSTT
jgi:hypothetical protein